MHFTVYRTTNLINGKIYIGTHQTDNPSDEYLGSGHNIKKAIAKYGEINFRKEILFDFDNASEMFAKEAELVNEDFCKRDDTYNICPGGKGGFGYINVNGLQLTEKRLEASRQTIKLAAARHKELQSNTEWKAIQSSKIVEGMRKSEKLKIANANRPPMSDEHKAAIGRANAIKYLGSGNPNYGKKWITDGIKSIMIPKDQPIPENFRPGRIKTVDRLVRIN